MSEVKPYSDNSLQTVARNSDVLVASSHWIIGGDGWAEDIDFGGLNHVLPSGHYVNILVLDRNNGAQISKATLSDAVMKVALRGNVTREKDLGAIALTHGHAYVIPFR